MWGNEIVFNLTRENTICRTACVCLMVPWLKGDAHQILLTGLDLSLQAQCRSLRRHGPKARTHPDQLCGILSSYLRHPLAFTSSSVLAAQAQLVSPHLAPMFVMDHHTSYFNKRHPTSPGCQHTELTFFLVSVQEIQSNSENWKLSSASRHLSLDHHWATNPQVIAASHLGSTLITIEKMKYFQKQTWPLISHGRYLVKVHEQTGTAVSILDVDILFDMFASWFGTL